MLSIAKKKKNEVNYLDISENKIFNNNKIKIYLVESNIDIYNDIARLMTNKLIENNQKKTATSFILPVGPKGQYKRFARICNMEGISCKNLITINMDEYLDDNGNLISENHPLSFRSFMRKNLFDLLGNDIKIKSENIYFPDPNSTTEIENLINDIGGADICFGGVGINGHIAFNEPLDKNEIEVYKYRELKTRVVDISKETIVINSLKHGGHIEFIPKRCITIGMNEIFKSKELRFYLEHDWQSAVLRKAIFQEPTSSFPVTFLKEHKNSSITISRNVLIKYL